MVEAILGDSWVNWVERPLLVISVAVNVVLWVYARRQDRRIRYADHNDSAWEAARSFSDRIGELRDWMAGQLDGVLARGGADVDLEAASLKCKELHDQWIAQCSVAVSEVRSKLNAHQAAAGPDRLGAWELAASLISRLHSPVVIRAREFFGGLVAQAELDLAHAENARYLPPVDEHGEISAASFEEQMNLFKHWKEEQEAVLAGRRDAAFRAAAAVHNLSPE